MRPALLVAVALLALAPRLEPALAGYHPSNDAAEHLLLARSLARGEGFTLPIRVRDLDGGPAVHEAFAERAPLYPLLLSVPVRLGLGAQAWPDARLQLLNVGLAALAALLAASCADALARGAGAGPRGRALAAIVAGAAVAWSPGLLRASVHLWAEPLGLVLALTALRLEAALAARPGPGPAVALGLVAGLARFARPEAWVLAVVIVGLAAARARRDPARRGELLAIGAAVALVNLAGIGWTGVLAPQLDLLRVARFEELMAPGAPPPPAAGAIVSGIATNAAALVLHLASPTRTWVVAPLALAACLDRRARGLVAAPALAAGGLLLAAAVVWSTSDPARFGAGPAGCLAPAAGLGAALVLRGARGRARRGAELLLLATLVACLGLQSARRRYGVERPPVVAQDGVPRLADPWSWALETGRPAVLAPVSTATSPR